MNFLDSNAKAEGTWPVRLLSTRKRKPKGTFIRSEALERHLELTAIRAKESDNG